MLVILLQTELLITMFESIRKSDEKCQSPEGVYYTEFYLTGTSKNADIA